MKRILFLLVIFTVFFNGCSEKSNRLVGHSYIVEPVNSILKLKLMMSLATIVHEYKSNHEVLITTYIGKEATSKEVQSYTFDGTTYQLNNDIYDVAFSGDTALFT